MQLTLLQNNEQEQPMTKTCLAPDTSKAEVERVRGMCALGNKKTLVNPDSCPKQRLRAQRPLCLPIASTSLEPLPFPCPLPAFLQESSF